MSRILWTLQLTFWLIHYGYVSWRRVAYAYRWSCDDDWQEYRKDGLTPRAAVLEDLSYVD